MFSLHPTEPRLEDFLGVLFNGKFMYPASKGCGTAVACGHCSKTRLIASISWGGVHLCLTCSASLEKRVSSKSRMMMLPPM